ncbi:hypothetical protein NDU88_001664 [Pleurodeles waltl]|uniref:Uncharacterized protein n=1 Tax=Pleurodeles waltl TaxID=8319 RepID=A0AAV7SAC7_PLEWA|nr:hypothetical protein NDU88_001664 [Pleurodeles waltl]
MCFYPKGDNEDVSRLSSNAALDASDWRCSLANEDSVPRCRSNEEDGACPMTPDFRVPAGENREDGRQSGEEEEDAEEPNETSRGERDQN